MKTPAVAFVLSVSLASAFAADDPIAVRKALMQSNAGAAATSVALMKGEVAYNPAVAKAAIAAMNATAQAMGDFFPPGSIADNSGASPKIWEDAAGFAAAVEKFRTGAAVAMQAAGKDGPPDLAAFQAAVGPVLDNCKACHEGYQIRQQ